MFERLRFLYSQGKITDRGLDRAVFKGLVTQAQAMEIRNTKYNDVILELTEDTT